MKVLREQELQTEEFKVGDRIEIRLPFETHMATAIKQTQEGMLFIFDDLLDEYMPMFSEIQEDMSYETSEVRSALKDLSYRLPEGMELIKFNGTDNFRIPKKEELFGENKIPYFDDEKKRVACYKNRTDWYWLQDKHVYGDGSVSAAYFASVYSRGDAGYSDASNPGIGLRPLALIRPRANQ